MVLYLLARFGKIKPWSNNRWRRRIDLAFWKTLKQICGKIQYREEGFGDFEDLPQFSAKFFFYLSTKFAIMKLWTNIQRHRRFDLAFWKTSKQIYRKLRYREKILENCNIYIAFSEKWFCVCRVSLAKQSLQPIVNHPGGLIYAFGILKIKFIGNSNLERKFLQSFKICVAFPRKWFCITRPNLAL